MSQRQRLGGIPRLTPPRHSGTISAMSLTSTDRHFHKVYEALPAITQTQIDLAYIAAVTNTLQRAGYDCPGDDSAECLVAAITRYLVESNPDHPAIKAALVEVESES